MTDAGDSQARARFERAFVATRYLLGHRSQALMGGLQSRSNEARRLALALGQEDRKQRALALAAAWGQVRVALDRRRYREESEG